MFIRDIDCTKETPIILGHPDQLIYGKGIHVKPRTEEKEIVNI